MHTVAKTAVWGFATMYIDYMVFSKQWVIADDSPLNNAFFVLNILVLGFLFGERAVRNVLPIILPMFQRKEIAQ